MNVLSVLPWKYVARRLSRRHGFVDPIELFDRMRRFAQPSEVGEPVELLRAGAAFHARGLVNRTVQFNLDWIWPYWIERQFNPADESFVPRAFSFSHINLTHRNWTAVGMPNVAEYPIIDPRGLLTPLFDGWSLDAWLVLEDGTPVLLPSRTGRCEQRVDCGERLAVATRLGDGDATLDLTAWVEAERNELSCVLRARGSARANAKLVISVRPYNPEGISFIDTIAASDNAREWRVNGRDVIRFGQTPERLVMSCYSAGDVLAQMGQPPKERNQIQCAAGMATAAAVFPLNEAVEVRIPIAAKSNGSTARPTSWRDELAGLATMTIPDPLWQRLYDTAVRTVLLHAPHEVYPGPYTYKRFWYRDAALILNALACIGAHARCRKALDLFPRGQLADGYFRSQEGEWDSNGEVLWIIERCFALSSAPFPGQWADMVERAARWILRKRMPSGSAHPGLLPAGFSAEHLGLNDFYYWDDFWGVAGLRAAGRLLAGTHPATAREFSDAAGDFLGTIETSIANTPCFKTCGAMPAAPDRRMDAGAIGSLVADFPLHLFAPGDRRTMATAEWLMANSFFQGGFFQNMIHSGINAYLTIHVAQVLLRAGDARAHNLIGAIADLASPTGQWPEAIHPRTLGGCMGDGQHVWAAAEWIVMMRNLFVTEEGDGLVIGRGIRPEWMATPLHFGPTATPFGAVTVDIAGSTESPVVSVTSRWFAAEPPLALSIPGYEVATRAGSSFTLRKAAS